MWARWSLRSRIARSFFSRTVARRIAREAPGLAERRLPGAAVVRKVRERRGLHVAVEVRQTPGDRHPEPGRRRRVVGVELREHLLERGLRILQVSPIDRQPRGDDLVVERRDEHLDLVLADDADPIEQMLLRRRRSDRRPLRGRAARQPVDELVDPGGAHHPDGGARENLPAGRAHVEWDGAISTSDRSSRFRYETSFR